MFYSPTTKSFYSLDINGSDMPDDVVEITTEEHDYLLAGNASGMVIVTGKNGKPELADHAPPSPEALIAAERAWRDSQLQKTEWITGRHRDEVDMQRETSLSAEQFAHILQYRQELRDWPAHAEFPSAEYRPEEPDWLDA